jgi:hypothetical protein
MQRRASGSGMDTLAALAARVGVSQGELSGTPADELEELFEVFEVPTLGKIRERVSRPD